MKTIFTYLKSHKSSLLLASMIFSIGILKAQPGQGIHPHHGGRPGTPNAGNHMVHSQHGHPNPGNHGSTGVIIRPRIELNYNTPNYHGYRGGYRPLGHHYYGHPAYSYGYGYGPQFNFNIQRRPFVCSHPGSPHTRRMERKIARRVFRLHMRHERLEHRRMRRH